MKRNLKWQGFFMKRVTSCNKRLNPAASGQDQPVNEKQPLYTGCTCDRGCGKQVLAGTKQAYSITLEQSEPGPKGRIFKIQRIKDVSVVKKMKLSLNVKVKGKYGEYDGPQMAANVEFQRTKITTGKVPGREKLDAGPLVRPTSSKRQCVPMAWRN